MERSKPLHNFNLPPGLTWGRQRTLKCVNINPIRAMPNIDEDNRSSNSDESIDVDDQHDDTYHLGRPIRGCSTDDQREMINFERPQRRGCSMEDPRLMDKSSIRDFCPDIETLSIEKDKITVTREKLKKKYESQIGKMQNLIVNNNDDEGESSLIPMKSKPKQRRDEKMDMDPRLEKISLRPRRNLEKKEERPKFSITLSRKEIEQDFIAITGKKPPRKSNRRPKHIQAEFNALFPGSWLSEIHSDRYKVKENGKD